MSSQFNDPDQWYSAYDAASAKQRHQMLLKAIETSLSSEFLQKADLGGLLLEMRDELVNNNLITEAISLITRLQQYQPELYSQEYPYFDKFLIQYYLYTSDLEAVKASLVRFEENPSKGIDEMFRVLDFLKFYNATDISTNLCQKTYQPIKNSPDVISGTEAELGGIILIDLMEKAYQTIKRGESVNWEELAAKVQEYEVAADEQWLADIQQDLVQGIQVDQQFFQAFKKHQSRQKIYGSLSVAFLKYMADEKQVSFICSQGIWETIFKFLIHHRELNAKKSAHPDSLFGFSQRELDRFVAQQIGGFFSLGPAAGFATLWGVPYLYDFLLAKQIIRTEIHHRAIAAATELKKQLTEGFTQLWQFDFVHRWLPPDSISQEDWDAEIKQFAASLASVTPLSDELGQGRMESLYQKLGQLIDDTKEEELPDSEGEEVDAVPSPSVKPYKPPKPKKSPLQEAAKLLAQEPKKPEKKPKKGFDSF